MRPGHDGDLDFYDFLAGQWAGVVSQSTVTRNQKFANDVASRQQAQVRVFSLVAHPVDKRQRCRIN